MLFMHFALTSQLCLFSLHSSTSERSQLFVLNKYADVCVDMSNYVLTLSWLLTKTSIGMFTIFVVGFVHVQVLHSWVCVILQINATGRKKS